jgi:hypothetical protein
MVDNVINLEQKQKEVASRRAIARRLRPRLEQITHEHMERVLQGMFDNADDTLFKMAEKAGGDDQSLYLDSMRIVRLQRKSIVGHFFDHLGKNFEAFDRARHADQAGESETPATSQIDYQNLELVSKTDLEVNLAVENLEHKIQAQYQSELSAIEKRLGWLYGKDKLEVKDIPFAPGRVVQAYFRAADAAELDLEVRLILLKLFDWHCLYAFHDLYNDINELFIEAGVMPVIKATIKPSRSPSRASGYAAGAPSNTAGGAEQGGPRTAVESGVFGTLQDLLARQRSGYTGHANTGAPPRGGSGTGHFGSGPLLVLSNDEVVQALTSLQSDDELQLPSGGAHATGSFVRARLEGGGEQDRQINPVDSDVIDVVCLIFEYILDDPQLPASARASIARLQIPMLKVAMLDKAFFAMQGHPARNLLNHLAKAALGIDDTEDKDQNPVLAKINEVVNEVLERFTDELALFEELDKTFCEFLEAYRSQEEQARREIEQRQQQREELMLARTWVRETLEQHLMGRTLPREIADIVLGPWKDVMLQTFMQEGEDSLLWKNQIRFIDVLCWSVAPKQLRLDRQKLGNIIHQLIKTLRTGLAQIDYPPEEVEAIFAILEPYHLASVRGSGATSDGTAGATAPTAEDHGDGLNSHPGASEDEYQGRSSEPGDKVIMEEVVLEGWEGEDAPDQLDDEYLQLARHLEMGKWVEFRDNEGKSRRAKLAWKSELLGEYTFLNWKFDVVADKSLDQLADDLRQGTARVVDDLPLMDRALSGVMNALTPKAG